MDQQVKQIESLGNGVIDTKTYLPLIAVKNGQMVHLSTDGFIDFSNVPKLTFPDSRFAFAVKFYEKDVGANIDATPAKILIMGAGRTELELNEAHVYFVEATLLTKENL